MNLLRDPKDGMTGMEVDRRLAGSCPRHESTPVPISGADDDVVVLAAGPSSHLILSVTGITSGVL